MVELKKRIKRPVLKRRRIAKRPVLKRRKKPDVYYCEKIKNRIPFPIECSWIGEMYECCKKCNRKIIYWLWKNGGYNELNERLKNRTYKQTISDIEEEEKTFRQASG